jgi:hypothetical protein
MPYKNWALGAIGISLKGVVCSVCWFCGVTRDCEYPIVSVVYGVDGG